MKIRIRIRSIRAYEQLLEAGGSIHIPLPDEKGCLYDELLIARWPQAVRVLLDELKAEGLVEMDPHTGSTGSRYLPTTEATEEILKNLLREQDEGEITIEHFAHNGEHRFVYRERVPDQERVPGTSGIYEYIGTIPLAIQQHGEQMIRWHVQKTARAGIEKQKGAERG